MSKAGSRLRTRFGGLRIRVVVPEFAGVIDDDSQGEPAVYATPFTLADSDALQDYIKEDSPEGYAQVVITKAHAESGERIFDVADKSILMQCVEAHVIASLAQKLMASTDLESARKNSEATQI